MEKTNNNNNFNDLLKENNTKQFIKIIKNYNEISKKKNDQISTYDKIHNYFSKVAFQKLKILGEDINNYGNIIIGSVSYCPKPIKIDYFRIGGEQKNFLSNNKINEKKDKNEILKSPVKINQQPVRINISEKKFIKKKIILPPITQSCKINKSDIRNLSPIKINISPRNSLIKSEIKDNNNHLRSKSVDKRLNKLPSIIYKTELEKEKKERMYLNINIEEMNKGDNRIISPKVREIKNKLEIIERKAKNNNGFLDKSKKIHEEARPQLLQRFHNLITKFNE